MERDRQLVAYERMTPVERNAELKGLFDYLPDFHAVWGLESEDKPLIDALIIGVVKREKSETRKILLERLKLLLGFSHTTQSFREYLIGEFDEMTTNGMDRHPLPHPLTTEAEFFTDIFKWGSQSGGIFDAKDAASIDREYYNHAVYLLKTEGWVEERLAEKGMGVNMEEFAKELAESFDKSEDDVAVEEVVKKHMERRKLVKDWRLEFIELHGDEP